MAAMFGNLYDALRSAGADDNKARQAAEEMASSVARVDTVEGLRSDLGEVRSDLAAVKNDVEQLKTDTAVLKWMAGFNLALSLALLGLLLRGLH